MFAPATLVVVGDSEAWYCKLRAHGEPIVDGHLVGFIFTVASVKRDGMQIPLSPPKFLMTEYVAAQDHWLRTANLLASM
jgi:hypothetical protein